jgi:hydroxyacylglutathione hydrolase
MILNHIKILNDNYVWILSNSKGLSIIIDPVDAVPIIRYIKKHHYYPISILLTHYHQDHIGGMQELLDCYPKLKIYGPPKNIDINKNINFVYENEIINIMEYNFFIISTPGHTKNDISYYFPPYLFCGDTLFSGGCGRIITGDIPSMFHSLKKISFLPNNTLICCGHEYTLSNLKFARYIFPEDKMISKYYEKIKIILKKKKSSLPNTLIHEKKINLFLRTKEVFLKKRMGLRDMKYNEEECFSRLRKIKDNFNWS